MQFTKRYNSGQRIQFIYVFLFGFFMGVFVMNMWKNALLGSTGFLNEEMLYQMKYARIDAQLFRGYVLQKRLTLFALLVMFATTYLGIAVAYGALIWFGFSFGMLLASCTIRYGFKGVLLFFSALLPQYLIYVPVFWMLLHWCYEVCASVYFPSRIYKEAQYRSRKAFVAAKGIQLFFYLLVVIIGILLESYVNPQLLLGLLKKF